MNINGLELRRATSGSRPLARTDYDWAELLLVHLGLDLSRPLQEEDALAFESDPISLDDATHLATSGGGLVGS